MHSNCETWVRPHFQARKGELDQLLQKVSSRGQETDPVWQLKESIKAVVTFKPMCRILRVSVPHAVVFAIAFVAYAGGGGCGRRMRPTREKYVSWEPVVGIASTCEKLIGNGSKKPTKVLAKIKSAIEASEGVGSFLFMTREEQWRGARRGGQRGGDSARWGLRDAVLDWREGSIHS